MDASSSLPSVSSPKTHNIHPSHSSEYLSLKKLGHLVLIVATLGPVLAMLISTLVSMQVSHKQVEMLEKRFTNFEASLKEMNLMPWDAWYGYFDRLNTRIERIEDKIWPPKVNE